MRKALLTALMISMALIGGCYRQATTVAAEVPLQVTATSTPMTPIVRNEREIPPTVTPELTTTARSTRTPQSTFTPRSPATVIHVTSMPTRTLPPLPPDVVRYSRGGINFGDPAKSVSMAYPASLDGKGWTEFYDLQLLVSEPTQRAFTQFITQFGGSVFVYADLPSGAFVLNVHSGRLKGSRQILEAEPLRQLLEGDLYSPYSREAINTNLAKLVGRDFYFAQGDTRTRFVVSQAARMGYAERGAYDTNPGDLSLFLGGLQQPERSFVMIFCSGRQPDEPSIAFPGYFVLGLTAAE